MQSQMKGIIMTERIIEAGERVGSGVEVVEIDDSVSAFVTS